VAESSTTYTTIDMRPPSETATYTWTWSYTTYGWWDCRYWWRWGEWSWCDWSWPWVTLEPFDFALDASPNQQTVKAGQSASFTVAVSLLSGASQPVTLSIANPPAGVTYSFSLSSGNPHFTSALKVSIDSSVPPGTQVLTIAGTGGRKTHSATVNLNVAKNKAESSLSISINPGAVRVGESISVGGALSPTLTTSIELVYTRPDGFEMTKQVSTTGAFSDTFKPDMPGSWSVRARWAGDPERYGSESQQARFTVEAAPATPPSFWDMIGGPGTLVALVAIVIALLALMRHRSSSKSPAHAKPSGNYCMRCGAAIPAGSGFCPKCGERT
jgi:hypothetical protein